MKHKAKSSASTKMVAMKCMKVLLLVMMRLLGCLTGSFAANTVEEAAASKEDDAKDSSNDDANDGSCLACALRAADTVNGAAELALGYGHPCVNAW